jgi:hypothetical protein
MSLNCISERVSLSQSSFDNNKSPHHPDGNLVKNHPPPPREFFLAVSVMRDAVDFNHAFLRLNMPSRAMALIAMSSSK